MRFGFEEILEQHRSDLSGRDQLSNETRRRLARQVDVIRTSIYATPHPVRDGAARPVQPIARVRA